MSNGMAGVGPREYHRLSSVRPRRLIVSGSAQPSIGQVQGHTLRGRSCASAREPLVHGAVFHQRSLAAWLRRLVIGLVISNFCSELLINLLLTTYFKLGLSNEIGSPRQLNRYALEKRARE
jgi:hypothetical protein